MMDTKKYTDFGDSVETQAKDYFQKPENTFAIGGYEWLPLGTDVKKLTEPYNAITQTGEKLPVSKSGTTVIINSNNNNSFYDIPLLYYKGYTAKLTDENGKIHKLTVEKSPNNNLVRVLNDNMLNGEITVSYSKTNIQIISVCISLLSLFTYTFLRIRKKSTQKNTDSTPAPL